MGIIVLISVPSVMAQSESEIIPNWIKGVANFWIDGGIDDADFIEALEFLIDNNVIKLSENIVIDNTMSEIPDESEMVTNLHKQIETLHDKIDEGEKNKDDLEEYLLKENSDSKQWYETEMNTFHQNWMDAAAENSVLKTKNLMLEAELDALK